MSYVNETTKYYNEKTDNFISNTLNVDMSKMQSIFLSYLNKGDYILDLGCGSGRDSRVFLQKGYNVTSVDGSSEICKKASDFMGQKVLNLKFEEIDFKNKFNGVWCCASLVHTNKKDLINILNKVILSLKDNGVIYVSFKYGDFEGMRNGRYFLDINEKRLDGIVSNLKNISIEKTWITLDVRKDKKEEKWLNAILVK